MVAVVDDEVEPGLVPFLLDNVLRASGRCKTDAFSVAGIDGSARKPRPFLILSVDRSTGICRATPTHARVDPSDKHVLLDNNLKENYANSKNLPIYVYKEQYWEIPIDVLLAASSQDQGRYNFHRKYAVGKDDVLGELLSFFEKDGVPIRELRLIRDDTTNS